MGYIVSEKVKLFPSAYRGTTEVEGELKLFNPESRIPSEYNMSNVVNSLIATGRDGFIISPITGNDFSKVIFNIHGYWFNVDLTDIVNQMGNNTSLWFKIRIKPKNPIVDDSNTDYEDYALDSFETVISSKGNELVNSNDTSLDVNGNFVGLYYEILGLDEDLSKSTNEYVLRVIKKTNSANISTADLFRTSSNYVEDLNSGKDITEHFSTKNLEVDNSTILNDTIIKSDFKIKNGTYNRVEVDTDGIIKIQNISGSNRIEISADGKIVKKYIGNNCIWSCDENSNIGNFDISTLTFTSGLTSKPSNAIFTKYSSTNYECDYSTTLGKRVFYTSTDGSTWVKGLDYQKANFNYDSTNGVLTLTYEE